MNAISEIYKNNSAEKVARCKISAAAAKAQRTTLNGSTTVCHDVVYVYNTNNRVCTVMGVLM